jgi:hypothetical protein
MYYISGTYLDTFNATQMEAYLASYAFVEIFFFIVFGFDYLITAIASTNLWKYVFSFMGIADFISLIPIVSVIVYYPKAYHKEIVLLSFLGFLRFFRLLKLFKLISFREVLWGSLHPYNSSIAVSLTETWFKYVFL